MRDREHLADKHPPTCSCRVCTEARTRGMTRGQYLQHLGNVRQRSDSFTIGNVAIDVSEFLKDAEKMSAFEKRNRDIKARLARGDRIEKSWFTGEKQKADGYIGETEKNFSLSQRRTWWKRMIRLGQ